MSKVYRVGSVLAVSAMLISAFGLAPVVPYQAQSQGRGNLKLIVTKSDGTPASGVTVGFFIPGLSSSGGPGSGGGGGGSPSSPNSVLPGSGNGDAIPLFQKAIRRVGQVVTDAEGKAEAKNLPAGTLTFRAGIPRTVGYKTDKVEVKANETVEVTIKLEPPLTN